MQGIPGIDCLTRTCRREAARHIATEWEVFPFDILLRSLHRTVCCLLWEGLYNSVQKVILLFGTAHLPCASTDPTIGLPTPICPRSRLTGLS